MQLIPKEFFVTSASASSDVSDLNAFDKALIKMGIGELNLVGVSSIIPMGAKEVGIKEIPMGAVTHCVLAQEYRRCQECIMSAGIAYAFRKDGKGGYVAEDHGPVSKNVLTRNLRRKMEEIAASRGVELEEIKFAIEEMAVPKTGYGACVAALVFVSYE
jgi:arginine decarboxylase